MHRNRIIVTVILAFVILLTVFVGTASAATPPGKFLVYGTVWRNTGWPAVGSEVFAINRNTGQVVGYAIATAGGNFWFNADVALSGTTPLQLIAQEQNLGCGSCQFWFTTINVNGTSQGYYRWYAHTVPQ